MVGTEQALGGAFGGDIGGIQVGGACSGVRGGDTGIDKQLFYIPCGTDCVNCILCIYVLISHSCV